MFGFQIKAQTKGPEKSDPREMFKARATDPQKPLGPRKSPRETFKARATEPQKPIDPQKTTDPREMLGFVRDNVSGRDAVYDGPFGPVKGEATVPA